MKEENAKEMTGAGAAELEAIIAEARKAFPDYDLIEAEAARAKEEKTYAGLIKLVLKCPAAFDFHECTKFARVNVAPIAAYGLKACRRILAGEDAEAVLTELRGFASEAIR